MLNNATINQLRELRLTAMAGEFQNQQHTPDITALSFEERFGLLVESEWLSRRDKRFCRLVRQASFRLTAVIEDIDYAGKNGISKPEVLKLSLGGYLKKALNILLCGPTGIGKTYLACALGTAACAQGVQVYYIRVPDFFRRTGDIQVSQRSPQFRDKCAMVPLLILDDWGLKNYTAEETAELSDLFERRYGRASTIICGQAPAGSWHELFPDPTQADSILDRIVHNAYKYNLSGESMRKTLGKRSLETS
jgi:DNA replication protein DnaC